MFYIRQEVKSKRQRRKCRKVCLVSALIWVISRFELTKPGIFLSPTHTLQPATELYWFKWFSIRTVLWVFSLRPVESRALFKRDVASEWPTVQKMRPALRAVLCASAWAERHHAGGLYICSVCSERGHWLVWGRAMQEICSDESWSVVVVTGNKEIKEV